MRTYKHGAAFSFLLIHHLFECTGLFLGDPNVPVIEGDLGTPEELHCDLPGQMISWFKDGQPLDSDQSWEEESDGETLTSPALRRSDAGNYTCVAEDGTEQQLIVVVKSPPPRLERVNIHTSTVVATVRWSVSDDGGYPILHFTLVYRPLLPNSTTRSSEDWHFPVAIHIAPAARQFFVYHLKPGTTYFFRMWASNRLGPGDPVILQTTTSGWLESAGAAQQLLEASDGELGSGTSAWVIAVSMVMGTVLVLSCLSCILIYKESKHGLRGAGDDDGEAHIITNPGFDLEDSPLLEHADLNDNTERSNRLNNNSVIRPSRV